MLVVIGTDCIGSCKLYYHMVMTTTAPRKISEIVCAYMFSYSISSDQYTYINKPYYFHKCYSFIYSLINYLINKMSLTCSSWEWRVLLNKLEENIRNCMCIYVFIFKWSPIFFFKFNTCTCTCIESKWENDC
jgi:hypothetical protein